MAAGESGVAAPQFPPPPSETEPSERRDVTLPAELQDCTDLGSPVDEASIALVGTWYYGPKDQFKEFEVSRGPTGNLRFCQKLSDRTLQGDVQRLPGFPVGSPVSKRVTLATPASPRSNALDSARARLQRAGVVGLGSVKSPAEESLGSGMEFPLGHTLSSSVQPVAYTLSGSESRRPSSPGPAPWQWIVKLEEPWPGRLWLRRQDDSITSLFVDRSTCDGQPNVTGPQNISHREPRQSSVLVDIVEPVGALAQRRASSPISIVQVASASTNLSHKPRRESNSPMPEALQRRLAKHRKSLKSFESIAHPEAPQRQHTDPALPSDPNGSSPVSPPDDDGASVPEMGGMASSPPPTPEALVCNTVSQDQGPFGTTKDSGSGVLWDREPTGEFSRTEAMRPGPSSISLRVQELRESVQEGSPRGVEVFGEMEMDQTNSQSLHFSSVGGSNPPSGSANPPPRKSARNLSLLDPTLKGLQRATSTLKGGDGTVTSTLVSEVRTPLSQSPKTTSLGDILVPPERVKGKVLRVGSVSALGRQNTMGTERVAPRRLAGPSRSWGKLRAGSRDGSPSPRSSKPGSPLSALLTPGTRTGSAPGSPVLGGGEGEAPAVSKPNLFRALAKKAAAASNFVVIGARQRREQVDRALWEACYLGSHRELRGRVKPHHADGLSEGRVPALDAALLPPRDDIVLLADAERHVRVQRDETPGNTLADTLGVTLEGKKVMSVSPFKPTAQAGVSTGWHLNRVNGELVDGAPGAEKLYKGLSDGDECDATFIRFVHLHANPSSEERRIGQGGIYAQRADGTKVEMRPQEAWVVVKRAGRDWLRVRRLRTGAELGKIEGDEGWILAQKVKAHNVDRVDKGLCYKLILVEFALSRDAKDADSGRCVDFASDYLPEIIRWTKTDGKPMECHSRPLHFVFSGKHGEAFQRNAKWEFREEENRLWFPERRKFIELSDPANETEWQELVGRLRKAAEVGGISHDIPWYPCPPPSPDDDHLFFVARKQVELQCSDGGAITLNRGTAVIVAHVAKDFFLVTHIQKGTVRNKEKGKIQRRVDGEETLRQDGLPVLLRAALEADYQGAKLMLAIRPKMAQRYLGDTEEHGVTLEVTALHCACFAAGSEHRSERRNAMGVVGELLKAGADVTARDADAWTPLHWAVAVRNSELLHTLLKHLSARGLTTGHLCVPTHSIPSQLSADTAEEWCELCLGHPLLGKVWEDEDTRLVVTRATSSSSGFLTAAGRVTHRKQKPSAFDPTYSISLMDPVTDTERSDFFPRAARRGLASGWQAPPTGYLEYPTTLRYDMSKRRLRVYRGDMLEFEAFVHPLTGDLVSTNTKTKLHCVSSADDHREAQECPDGGKQRIDTLLHWCALRGDKDSAFVLLKNLVVGRQRAELQHDESVVHGLLSIPNYTGELPFVTSLLSEGIQRTPGVNRRGGFDDDTRTITLSSMFNSSTGGLGAGGQTITGMKTCLNSRAVLLSSQFNDEDDEGQFPLTKLLLRIAATSKKLVQDSFIKELRKWTHDPASDQPRLPYLVRRRTRAHGEKPLQQLMRLVRQAIVDAAPGAGSRATMSGTSMYTDYGRTQTDHGRTVPPDVRRLFSGSTEREGSPQRVAPLFRSEVLGLLDARAVEDDAQATTTKDHDTEDHNYTNSHRNDEQELLTLVLLRVVHDACAAGDSDLLTELLHGGTVQELEKKWGRLSGAAWVVKYENRVESALSLACRFGHMSVVRTLVEEFHVPITAHGNIALLQSLESRHFDIARYLLVSAKGAAGLHRLTSHEGDAFFIPCLDELDFALSNDLLGKDYLHWCVTNVSRWLMPQNNEARTRLRGHLGLAALVVLGMQNDYMEGVKRTERWDKHKEDWDDAVDIDHHVTGTFPVPGGYQVIPRIAELWRTLKGVVFDRVIFTQSSLPEERRKENHFGASFKHSSKNHFDSRYARRGKAAPWRPSRTSWDVGLPQHCIAGTDGAAFRSDIVSETTMTNVHRIWTGRIEEAEIAEIVRMGVRPSAGRYSAFHDGDGKPPLGIQSGLPLVDFLRKHDVRHVYVCGLPQEQGVIQTACDALDEGFQVTLITDCLRSHRVRRPSTMLDDVSETPRIIRDACERGCQKVESKSLMQGQDLTRLFATSVLRALLDSPQVDLSFIFHHSVDSEEFHNFLGRGEGMDFGDAVRRGQIFLHLSVLCSAGRFSASKAFPNGFTLAGLKVKKEHFGALQWPLQYLMVTAREGKPEHQQPAMAVLHAVIDVINEGCHNMTYETVSFGVGADGCPARLESFARAALPQRVMFGQVWSSVFESRERQLGWVNSVQYAAEQDSVSALSLLPLDLAVRLGMHDEVERMLDKERGLRRRRERGFGVDYEVEVVEDWWRPSTEPYPLHGALRELRYLRTCEGAARLRNQMTPGRDDQSTDAGVEEAFAHSGFGSMHRVATQTTCLSKNPEADTPGTLDGYGVECHDRSFGSLDPDNELEELWSRCCQGTDKLGGVTGVKQEYKQGCVLCLADDSWANISSSGSELWRSCGERREELLKVVERLLRSGSVDRKLWFRGQSVEFVPLNSPRHADIERKGRLFDRCGLLERTWAEGAGEDTADTVSQASDDEALIKTLSMATNSLARSMALEVETVDARRKARAAGGKQLGDTGLSLLLQGAPEMIPVILKLGMLREASRRLTYDGLDELVTRSDAVVIVQQRHLWKATQGGHEVLAFDRGLGLLHWACLRDSPELLEELVALKAHIVRQKYHQDKLSDRERWVGKSSRQLCSTTELGFTVLHYACYSGAVKCIEKIVRSLSADQLPHATIAQFINLTAFHRVTSTNKDHELFPEDIAEIEAAVRGNVHWCCADTERSEFWADEVFNSCLRLSTDGQTALHLACQFGHVHCAAILLENAADCSLRDRLEGLDAHDVALALRNRLTVEAEEGWPEEDGPADHIAEQRKVLDKVVTLMHTHPNSEPKILRKYRMFAAHRFFCGPARIYIMFAIFLTLVVMLVLSSSFWFSNAVADSFVGTQFINTETVNGTPASGSTIKQITTATELLLWLRGPFKRSLWISPGPYLTMGALRIYQLRVTRDQHCPTAPEGMAQFVSPCYPPWTVESNNETTHSGMDWRSEPTLFGSFYSRWTAQRWPNAEGLVLQVPSNDTGLAVFEPGGALEAGSEVFDAATRLVVLSTTLYNPGTAHFIAAEVHVELPAEGGAYVSWQMSPFRLDHYQTTSDLVRLLFECLLIVLLIHYSIEEVLDAIVVWKGCCGDCVPDHDGYRRTARKERSPMTTHIQELGSWCLKPLEGAPDVLSRSERHRRMRIGAALHAWYAWGCAHEVARRRMWGDMLGASGSAVGIIRKNTGLDAPREPFNDDTTGHLGPPSGDSEEAVWDFWFNQMLEALQDEIPVEGWADCQTYFHRVSDTGMAGVTERKEKGIGPCCRICFKSFYERLGDHLGSNWNLLDIIIAVLGWILVSFRIFAVVEGQHHHAGYFASPLHAHEFWANARLSDVSRLERQLLAVMVVLVWIKLFKVIRELPFVGPAVGAVVAVLYSESFGVFVLIYVEILVAFTLGGYTAFSYDEKNYRTTTRAFFNIFSMMAGTWEWEDHEEVELGHLVFFMLVFFCHIVLLNIFIAVIVDAYSLAYRQTRLQWNELISEQYVRYNNRLELPGPLELGCFGRLGKIPSFFLSVDPLTQYKMKDARRWYFAAADRKAIESQYTQNESWDWE
eukprot:Hpha_TRINITY_DN16798_c1_g4::TRINITY_DN16798_c1_g4_i1::g.77787::m.77787